MRTSNQRKYFLLISGILNLEANNYEILFTIHYSLRESVSSDKY
jgi:hypothetical protein